MSLQNFSSNDFKYGGKKYNFSANIHLNLDGNTELFQNYINNEDIILFSYENTINTLFLTGELVVLDKYGVIDRYLDKQLVFVQIMNNEMEQMVDGDIALSKFSNTRLFEHEFIVTKINILERKGTYLVYQLKLVSNNWLNCMTNITYTNYNTTSEDIFNIIKSLLELGELQTIEETFKELPSGVKIHYTTQRNDTIVTAVKYLLNKLYYYRTTLNTFKCLIYNETLKKYQVFDITNQQLINGVDTLVLSMFKNNMESLISQQPLNIATVTKMPNTAALLSNQKKEFYDYNFNLNVFVDKSFDQKTILDFRNSRAAVNEYYDNRFQEFKSDREYVQAGTYWNNDINIYGETSQIFNEDNALILNSDPNILRRPGSYIVLNFDRNIQDFDTSEDIDKLANIKDKYLGLEGLWLISKVRHMISPKDGTYRQNIVLFRNFVKFSKN